MATDAITRQRTDMLPHGFQKIVFHQGDGRLHEHPIWCNIPSSTVRKNIFLWLFVSTETTAV
jgi:hypothetical protein